VSEDPPRCGLGDRLSHAQQDGFFSWFCLCAVGADEPPLGGQVDRVCTGQRFRPSGPRFHHLVELAVALDESTCIKAASLSIARSLIEQPAIRPFARDITKSFLGWVLPIEAQVALRRQIALIGAFADGESVVIAHPDAPRLGRLHRLLGRGNEAAVFMGRRTRSKRRIGRTRIVLENRDGTRECAIGAGPVGEGSSTATARRARWLLLRASAA
jgi:hypothetical protein